MSFLDFFEQKFEIQDLIESKSDSNHPQIMQKLERLLKRGAEEQLWAKLTLGHYLTLRNIDFERGIDLLLQASNEGNSLASRRLGRIYWQGIHVAKDLEKGLEYLERALDYASPYVKKNIEKEIFSLKMEFKIED